VLQEAEYVFAQDQVIPDLETNELAPGHQLPRQGAVLGAGCGDSARMVVRDEDRGRAEQQRRAETTRESTVVLAMPPKETILNPVIWSCVLRASRRKCSWSASRRFRICRRTGTAACGLSTVALGSHARRATLKVLSR